MVSYKKEVSKTQKRRRSKKGGDGGDGENEWDIEMGPSHEVEAEREAARAREAAERAVANDANLMETGTTLFDPEPNNPGPEYLGGKRRRGNKSKKHYKKGSMSKTRKGRKDFVTHKGDKYYNRKGKHHSRSRSGRKGRPYSRRSRK